MGDLGTLLSIIITLAIVAYYRIKPLRAWAQRNIMSPSQPVREIEPIAINRQSDAVNQLQTDLVQAIKPRFEPVDMTPQELVQFLALVTLVRGDERGQVSQEGASRAAGISKVTAAAIMAETRGVEPNPVEPYSPTKHLLLDGGERWIAR